MGRGNKTRPYDTRSYCRVCHRVFGKALRCPFGHRMRNKPKDSKLRQKYLYSPMIMGIQMAEFKKDWKKEPPSEKQLNFIKSLGSSEEPKTSGEASGIINRLMLVQKINKIRTNIIKNKILTQAQVDTLTKTADTWFYQNIVIYCSLADNCLNLGMDEPAQIGMLFNNYLADQRKV